MRFGDPAIPVANSRQQFHVAADQLNDLMVGRLDRAMAAEDVGDLANEQPQLRELQRNVFETKQGPGFCRMPLEQVGVDVH